jgi:hypothetical protein
MLPERKKALATPALGGSSRRRRQAVAVAVTRDAIAATALGII